MNSQFHIIDKSTWERSVYFDYYYNQIKCKYNLNANLDITRLVAAQKVKGLRFFPGHHESRQPQQGIPDEFRRGRAIRILGRGSALLHAFPPGDQDVHRHLERIQRRFRHVLSDHCSGHRGVPERDGRHQGTPRTTRQLLPRVVPAVAELHSLRARHVHREQTPFPPHQVREILRGGRADTDTRFRIRQPRRSRRIPHLQAHQRHAGDSGGVLRIVLIESKFGFICPRDKIICPKSDFFRGKNAIRPLELGFRNRKSAVRGGE